MEYAIKVRMPGTKKFFFLTPRGGLNALRIHAGRFDDKAKAEKLIDLNKDDPVNAGVEWKVTPLN